MEHKRTYVSWTGCVPQEPWQPSPGFLHWLKKECENQREYVRNNAWIFSLKQANKMKAPKKAGRPKGSTSSKNTRTKPNKKEFA